MLHKDKNRVVLYSGTNTLAATTPLVDCSPALRTLAGGRNRGRYVYGYGLRMRAVSTFTVTGAGGTLEIVDKLKLLSSVLFSRGGDTRMNGVSFLDLVRIAQQGCEIYSADKVGDHLPIASTAVGAGPVTVTIDFTYPLCLGMVKQSMRDKLTGLESVAELAKNGTLKIGIPTSTMLKGTAGACWDCGTVAYLFELLTVELEHPVEVARVYEVCQSQISEAQKLVEGDGERLYSNVMLTDHSTDPFVFAGTAGAISVDGTLWAAGVDGSDLVNEDANGRDDGINDIFPAVCPIVTPIGRDLEECLAVRSTLKIENMQTAHTGNYNILSRFSKRIDLASQKQIMQDHGVPGELIERYVASVNGRTTLEAAREIGLATRTLAA